MTDTPPSAQAADPTANQQRRSFLTDAITFITWAIISLFGVVVGLAVFLDPLRRKPKVPLMYDGDAGQGDGFLRVAALTAVPASGVPQRYPVISDLSDAWTFSPNQPIGAIWVVRDAEDKITVLHTTCPHAGCAIAFNSKNGYFQCPCHNSAFDVGGQLVDLPGTENPSPRPMDPLEWEDRDGSLYVKFENFYPGIHDKKPKL